jgi:hypothetical protein
MANLVKRIKKKLPAGCIAKGKYRKKGCSVSLKGAPTPPIMIDLDKPQAPVGQNAPKCDYIFIGGCGDVWLAPLELKKGELDASKVVKQLQAGADIAARIIPAGEQVQFQPVAVFGGRLHPAQQDRLSQSASQIRFRGKRFNIRLLRCGQPLIEARP